MDINAIGLVLTIGYIIRVGADRAHGHSEPFEAQLILRFFQPFKGILFGTKRTNGAGQC